MHTMLLCIFYMVRGKRGLAATAIAVSMLAQAPPLYDAVQGSVAVPSVLPSACPGVPNNQALASNLSLPRLASHISTPLGIHPPILPFIHQHTHHPNATMSFRDKPEDLSAAAEEYELSSSHDPLLARYAGGRSPDPEGGLAIGGGSTRRRLRRRGLIIGGAVAMSVLVPMGVLACMPGAKLGEWEVPSVNGWKHPGNQNPHFPT